MARIKNVSSKLLLIGPGGPGQAEAWLPAGQQLVMRPDDEKVLFDEDLERSPAIKAMMIAGDITLISDEEPNDGSPVADAPGVTSAATTDLTDVGGAVNLANGLVKLDGTGKLPALDASALTNLPGGGGGSAVGSVLLYQVHYLNGDGMGPYAGFIDQFTGTKDSEDKRSSVMPVAGTMKNLYIKLSAAVGGTNPHVFTVRKNGADTALTLTINAGESGTKTNLVDTVAFAAGDVFSLYQDDQESVVQSFVLSLQYV